MQTKHFSSLCLFIAACALTSCEENSTIDSPFEDCAHAICPKDESCFQGSCHSNSAFCADVICLQDEKCNNGVCEKDLCGKMICPADQICSNGNCHAVSDFCGDILCKSNQKCFQDICYDIDAFCGDIICSPERKCYQDKCYDAEDFCGDIICEKGQTCQNNTCIDTSSLCGDTNCQNDQKCYQNKCYNIEDFCGDIICEKGQTCQNNTCIDTSSLCGDTNCQNAQKCYKNKCYNIEDFCGDIICEKGQVCDKGQCAKPNDCPSGQYDANQNCIVLVDSIELTSTSDVLLFNETLDVKANVKPDNATNKKLKWTKTISAGSNVTDLDSVFNVASNAESATITNKQLNLHEVKIKVVSESNPNVYAEKTIKLKPYIKPDKDYTREYLPCKAYDEISTQVFNSDLYTEFVKPKMQVIGNERYGTRASIVAAARFLTLQFPYHLRYYDNTHSVTLYPTESHYIWTTTKDNVSKGQDVRIFGLNLTSNAYNSRESKPDNIVQNNVIPWSCDIQEEKLRNGGPNGLACSGYVTWSIRNGRFYLGDWWTHIFGNYGNCTVNGKSVRHVHCKDYVNGITNSNAANPYNVYDDAFSKLNLLTEDDFIKVKTMTDAQQKRVKAGDLLWHGKYRNGNSAGHIAMIIGVERNNDNTLNKIYVGEASKYGNGVTTLSQFYLKNCSTWADTTCTKDSNGNYIIDKDANGNAIISSKKDYDSFIIQMDKVYNYYFNTYKTNNMPAHPDGNEYEYTDYWK